MKEWLHPLHSNAFAAPFMNFLVMAWLATKWEQVSGNEDLARVLFWIGSAPLAILTIAFIARQVMSLCANTVDNYVAIYRDSSVLAVLL